MWNKIHVSAIKKSAILRETLLFSSKGMFYALGNFLWIIVSIYRECNFLYSEKAISKAMTMRIYISFFEVNRVKIKVI